MNKKIAMLISVSLISFAIVAMAITRSSNGVGNETSTVTGDGTTATYTVDAIAVTTLTLSGDLTAVGTIPITSISATIATNANGGTNVVTFACTDLNGDAVSDVGFRMYISDTADGNIAAVAGDVAVDDGIELQQVTDKGDYWLIATNAAGTCVVTITDTPAEVTFVHSIGPDGRRVSNESDFETP